MVDIGDLGSSGTGLDDEGGFTREAVCALDLYWRWEKQNWQIAALDLDGDREGWHGLPSFARRELLNGLRNFFLGEVAVTETLTPLATHAPERDFQFYLCTQLADEARHTIFFQSYLDVVEGSGTHRPEHLHQPDARGESFGTLFEHELARATGMVSRQPRDDAQWYRAVAVYHLLAEGVLALTVLRSIRELVQALQVLPALAEGVTNVARDESRHVSFGVVALRHGVREGFGESVKMAIRDTLPLLVRALVEPERRDLVPVLRPVIKKRGMHLHEHWEKAANALQRRVSASGLDEFSVTVRDLWMQECERAVAEYEEIHGIQHPTRYAS